MPAPAHPVPLKRVLFRLHWMLGLSAGLVLAVVGFSGGLLGFEEPVMSWLNPAQHIAADGRDALPPDRWIANARAAWPQLRPRSIAWNGADTAVSLRMARGKERGVQIALDPYSGQVLGVPRGTAFFEAVERVHRSLAAGAVGKQIVGASTGLLIVLMLTGVYLRWPRRPRSLSAWLRFEFRLKGRGFLWHLHAVCGTWLLLFYLVAASTGLWWSYDFYRNAVNRMAGVTTPLRRPSPPAGDATAPLLPLDRAWAAFRLQVPDATRANIALSSDAARPLEIRYQTPDSPHERAWNTLRIDAASGAIDDRELYAQLPRGRRFVYSLFPLHSGSFFGAPGSLLMALASLLLPLFAITGIWLWLLRRRAATARNRRMPRTAMRDEALVARVIARELRGLDPDAS